MTKPTTWNRVLSLGLISLFFLALLPPLTRAVDETTIEELVPNEFNGGGVAQGWNADNDEWTYSLPFTFSFYGEDYTEIKVGSDGIICFDSKDDCTRYSPLDDVKNGPFIVPMGLNLMTNHLPSNDIYIDENANRVIIRWDAVQYRRNDQINFEVVLYRDGNIKFNYGDQSGIPLTNSAYVGISSGDGANYTASAYNETTDFQQVDTSAWGDFGPENNSFYPLDGETNVPPDINLSIAFDRNIYAGTGGSITIKKSNNNSTIEKLNITSSQITGWGTATLNIDPAIDLPSNTSLYIKIDDRAIKDIGGKYFPGISDNLTWNFTTRDTGHTFSFSDGFITNDFIDSANTTAVWYRDRDYIGLEFTTWTGMDGMTSGSDILSSGFDLSVGSSARMRPAVLDGSGRPVVAWYDGSSGGDNEIFVAHWNGSSWTGMDGTTPGPENISNTSSNSFNPVLALDFFDYPIVAWEDISLGNREVFVSRWNGSAWTQMDGITPGYDYISSLSGSSLSIDMVIDNTGKPILTWYDFTPGNYEIYVSRWNGSAWTQMDGTTLGYDGISNDASYSYDPLIDLDSMGNPIVAWRDSPLGDDNIFVSRWNGTAWSQMDGITPGYENISGTDDSSSPDHLLVDSSGYPIISWRDQSLAGSNIFISRWNGSSWTGMDSTTPGYDNISGSGTEAALSQFILDTSNNPIVVWRGNNDPNYEIYVSRWNGTAWTQMDGITPGYENISDNAGNSTDPSLSIDHVGNPVIVWQDSTVNDREIYISYWNGTAWTRADGITPGYEKASGNNFISSHPDVLVNGSGSIIVNWKKNADVYLSVYSPHFNSPGTIQSLKLNGLLEDITGATFTATASTPGASRIEYYLSNDGGSTWTEVQNGEELTFASPGSDLRYKAVL